MSASISCASVNAQKLLFAHTEAGDLNTLFSDYFDTPTGNKREVDAYKKIIDCIKLSGGEILFLSAIEQELDAAAAAGMRTTQLCREDTITEASGP